MGYPNLPVMSIEEFYDKRAREGWYDKPDSHAKNPANATQNDLEKTEEAEDKAKEELEALGANWSVAIEGRAGLLGFCCFLPSELQFSLFPFLSGFFSTQYLLFYELSSF